MSDQFRFDSVEALKEQGLGGFFSIGALKRSKCASVPSKRGVYFVIWPDVNQEPEFLQRSVGGYFKGEDPTVSKEELEENWVPGVVVLYIGQTGGRGSGGTLQKRLWTFMRFGLGEGVGHKGGRLIWQLRNHDDLKVCWWAADGSFDPREHERDFIYQFETIYGQKPFANLQG